MMKKPGSIIMKDMKEFLLMKHSFLMLYEFNVFTGGVCQKQR